MTLAKNPWLPLILCLLVCLAGVVDRDLWTPDEPRVAAVALEMSRTGDVLMPRLAGEPFVEKPPLYFAVASLFVRAFGPLTGETGAIRLSSAFWGFGVLLATFLLARRLLGRDPSLLAVALLGTMWGFVIECTHWIRVDVALCFFVVASIWAFAEVYLGRRPWFCVPAALFAACAFLVKGLVGPGLIGIGWAGLVIPWMIQQRRDGERWGVYVLPHIVGLSASVLLAAAWALAFRSAAGPELWHEWLIDNHLGRLTGKAPQLGHLKPGRPFYYLKTVAVYTLPWLPLVLIWVANVSRRLRDSVRKGSDPRAADLFLLVWCIGVTVVMSISRTKRDLYLAPLLPAFAVMCAESISAGLPRWCRYFFAAWAGTCVFVLAVFTISPIWASLLPSQTPMEALSLLGTFTARHAVTLLCAAGGIYLLRGRIEFSHRLVCITALLYVGLFAVPFKAVDLVKSMERETLAFAQATPRSERPRIAGYRLSETTRACLYYYADWPVPQIDDQHFRDVISGADGDFDSVLVAREYRDTPPLDEIVAVPHRVLAAGLIGNRRELYWVARKKPSTP